MSEIKRMRYFKKEFLKNEDFVDEQEYHRRMRYRHNKDFHTWGIGDGLGVTFTPGDHSVHISLGIAVDGEGKEIILEEPQILDFSKAGYEGGESYYVTITWSQEEGEPKQENEAKRWVERPGINTSKTLPARPELALVLALVILNPDRTIAAVDDSGRHYAQIGIPDGSVTEAKLADDAVTSAKIKDGSVGTSTLVDKAVTRTKIGDGSVNEDKLSTSVLAKLVTNGDAHTHSAQDVGALPNAGGTVNGNLQVNGDVNISKQTDQYGYTGVIDFGGKTGSEDHWRFVHRGAGDGKFMIYRNVSGTYVGPFLTVTTGGRMGIGFGPEEPEETLHVNGSVRGNQEGGALRINTRNGYVDIGPQDQSYSHFTTDRETFYFNKRVMIDGGEIGSSGGQDMKLQTGGETRVTIKQDNGNVGIGTTNPWCKLDINGGSHYPINAYSSQRYLIRLAHIDDIGGGWLLVNEPNNFFAICENSGGDRLIIKDGGNVGIGTTNPLEKLHIDGSVRGNIEGALRISTGNGYVDIGPQNPLWSHFQTDRPLFYFEKGITVDSGCIGSYNENLQLQTSGSTRITIRNDNGFVGIGTPDPEFHLHTNGTSYANYRAGGGIDYAEYFESKNGKEIKAGTSVVLDGDKIKAAKENEIPIGVISASPGIVGGVHVEWPEKYLKDEFGNQIMEKYKEEIMAPKKEKVKKERQKMAKKTVKEKVTGTEVIKIKGKYCQKEVTQIIEREIEEPVFKEEDLYDAEGKKVIGKHLIPVMETYEEEVDVLDENGQPVMAGTGKFETRTRPKINPEYDETKEYIPREKRPEWNCVGLLGQLPLRKGQPVAPTWVKLKDLTKDVELWLVK